MISMHKTRSPRYVSAWVSLLVKQPQFAENCDFEKFCGRDWAELLSAQPILAGRCEWSKLDNRNMASLLAEQPQFAGKCDLDKFSGGDWATLLSRQPQFADKCDFDKFDGWDWSMLLSRQPQFADKCDWNKLYSILPDIVCHSSPESYQDQQSFCWVELLKTHPMFAEKCDWNRFTGKCWALLLRVLPQYADKCEWDKLYEKAIVKYCDDCEQYGSSVKSGHCFREGKEATFSNWGVLLSAQPQFADKCDWGKLNAADRSNPRLARLIRGHCPKEYHVDLVRDSRLLTDPEAWDLDYFSVYRVFPSRNVHVIPKQSGYAMMLWLRYNYKSAKPDYWSKLNGSDWVGLLLWKPHLATHCDWSRLTGDDWATLLSFYPEFADKCDWSKAAQ